jgi:hypothetical protein
MEMDELSPDDRAPEELMHTALNVVLAAAFVLVLALLSGALKVDIKRTGKRELKFTFSDKDKP